jgi:hypothetical protein
LVITAGTSSGISETTGSHQPNLELEFDLLYRYEDKISFTVDTSSTLQNHHS